MKKLFFISLLCLSFGFFVGCGLESRLSTNADALMNNADTDSQENNAQSDSAKKGKKGRKHRRRGKHKKKGKCKKKR